MAGIVFYFEDNDIDVWSGRSIDFDAWNYACKAAGDIDKITVVNHTQLELRTPDENMNFNVASELPDNLAGNIAYICCPWDNASEKISLWDFDHNVDWYVFGPASGWHKNLELGVYVPLAGQAALHSVHVASIVLTHRYKALSWQ